MSLSSPVRDNEENEEGNEPRRGGRTRKQVDRFVGGGEGSRSKRKQTPEEEEVDEDSDLSEEEEEAQPARKKRTTAKSGQKKSANGTTTGGGKKRKSTAKENGAGQEKDKETNGSQLKTDCPLFNALTSPDIALIPLIEEWIDTYQNTAADETSEKASVHELVTFFVRCCGLNADIEEDEAVDVDGILDTLERIQDESVKIALAAYPLIARTKDAKTFRLNLAVFIPNLIKLLALTPILYADTNTTAHSTPLLPLILNWLHSMSSSPLRSIRHTSTHLALKICSALCDVAADVSKDLSLKQRQKDAEARKGGQGPAAKKKLADLEAQVAEAREKKKTLKEYMQETFDVLFVHRVRDSDAAIRTDCLRELGVWAKKFGEMYIGNQHLSYFTRGCNDPDAKARLETVKALTSLLGTENNINRARTVLLRLAPRLVEMSLRDVDLNVRINALSIITEIDKTGIFEDEDEDQRSHIARLVFDNEPKVRKAVAGFVRGLWEQKLEAYKTEWAGAKGAKKKRAGKITDDDMATQLGYKTLARLLLDTAESLDEAKDKNGSTSQSTSAQAYRANAAVEALWDGFEELQAWDGLMEYLLLDHSEADDMWLLEEEEESLLLRVLVECIKKDQLDDEDEKNEQTASLMTSLPRLYKQHQADSERMTGLLAIPQEMNLALYQSMGKSSAYEALWDDITKQFLRHTDTALLTAATKAIVHLTHNGTDSENKLKLADLDETVFTSLRDAVNGEGVAAMSMDEDRISTTQAILLRISLLQRSRDMVDVMQDEEGGQSSGWEIVCAFAERGEVGFKEESKLVEYAIQIVFLHLTWLFKKLSSADAEDEDRVADLVAKRDRGRDIFQKLALRDKTSAAESIRRQAFIAFLNLHMLFAGKTPQDMPAAKAAPLKLEDEVQHRLGGAFGAVIERYASDREEMQADEDEQEEDTSRSAERAQHEIEFLQLVAVFVGAIRCSVLDVEQSREALSHYGRFGPTYDAIMKKLVDPLRDEGIYNKEATTVQYTAGAALKDSFTLFLDSEDEEPVASIGLAKMLASAFIVQGNHFTILKQIHPADVCDLHTSAIDEIGKKLTNTIKAIKNNKSKTKERSTAKLGQMLTFFKALIFLLGPVTGKDAVKIRNHLEEVIQDAGATVNSAKIWEGYRAYEKRLLSIASKNPGVKIVAQQKKKAVEEDTEVEATDDEDEGVEKEKTPTPKSVPSKRRASQRDEEEEDNAEAEEEEIEVEDADVNEMDVDLGLDLDGGAEGDVALDDLEFDLDAPGTQDSALERARSVSIEPPVVKRRKTVRRF